nr:hypothetical protein [Tanacetum cinerariifolium]
MLNKDNYVPWSSRLLWYAKSRPNGKLIHNSIINGPYVKRMIPEPGDTNREVPVNETFHVQTNDELTKKELKQIEADDQAIQTIFLSLPEDIYAAVDSCETAQEIWLRVQQRMKGSDIGIQEKKAKLFNEWEMFTSNDGESIVSYYHRFLKLMNDLKRNKHFSEKIAMPYQDQPIFNQNYMQQPMPNLEDIIDPITAMNMALSLMAKAFKLKYSTPTNNNQRISSNPCNREIAQLGMNMGQDRKMQMVGGNGENQFRPYAGQNVGNLNGYNDVQNVKNQSNYVLEILKKYGMESCDPVGTPMEIRDKVDLDQNGTPVDAAKYRSMIGALMYLTSSRPDIDSGFELTGFSDDDYAGCKDTFKSSFGEAQVLGEKLLTNYGFHFKKILIYCDSKSAIAISYNPVQHSRTKHIAIRYHFIKEHVEKGTIELYFVKTYYQLADIFTKALPADRFNYLVRQLGMRSLSSKELDCLVKSQ